MPTTLPASWSSCRVYGTWRNADQTRAAGTFTVAISNKVRNNADGVEVRAGVFDSGSLVTEVGSPTIDRQVPIVDDPDISGDFNVTVTISFTDAPPVTIPFVLHPTQAQADAGGIDLTTYLTPAQVADAGLVADVPGGYVTLDSAGYLRPDVFDPDLNIGSGTGGLELGLGEGQAKPGPWTPDAADVGGLVEKIRDVAADTLEPGYGVDVDYDADTGKITIVNTAGLTSDAAVTAVGAALVGEGLDITLDDDGPDGGIQITLTVPAQSWANLLNAPDTPAVIAAGATDEAARDAIGAGTSSLALGATADTAKPGDYTPAWSEVTAKPTTYPPSTHSHAQADVTGLTTALGAKADVTALAGYLPATSTGRYRGVTTSPTAADITGWQEGDLCIVVTS